MADAASADALWPSLIAGLVLVVTLIAWAVDHSRMTRRLAALERAEAFFETDLADARREVADLRDCLRDRGTRGADSTAAEPPGPLN